MACRGRGGPGQPPGRPLFSSPRDASRQTQDYGSPLPDGKVEGVPRHVILRGWATGHRPARVHRHTALARWFSLPCAGNENAVYSICRTHLIQLFIDFSKEYATKNCSLCSTSSMHGSEYPPPPYRLLRVSRACTRPPTECGLGRLSRAFVGHCKCLCGLKCNARIERQN